MMTTSDPATLLNHLQKTLGKKLESFGNLAPDVVAVYEQLQQANRHLLAEEWAEAAAAYDQVAALAATANQLEIQSQARYSQGGMLFALPQQHSAAIEAFQQTIELTQKTGNTALAEQAQQKIEQLQQRSAQMTADVSDLDEAIAALNPQKMPRQAIELYGQRGKRYALAQQFAQATQDFEAAFAIATQSNDPELMLLALSQLQPSAQDGDQDLFSAALNTLTDSPEIKNHPVLSNLVADYKQQIEQLLNLPAEILDPLNVERLLSFGDGTLDEAQKLSERTTHKLNKLQENSLFQLATTLQTFQSIQTKLQANQFKTALDLAGTERKQALTAKGPERYLRFTLACTLMSQAYEGLKDYPATIEILLNCKATLEHALGKEAGKPILDLLNALETRWGKETLIKARKIYREHMKRNGRYRLDPR